MTKPIMNVIEDTKNFPPNADPSDFDFLRRLITELDLVPTKDKVTFPLPSRNSAFADISCTLSYDSEYKPYAEFFFRSERHELQMAHSAVVLCVVDQGVLKYHLQITPNKRLRSNGHKRICSNHTGAKATALAICKSYFPGSVGRKVIPYVVKSKTAA